MSVWVVMLEDFLMDFVVSSFFYPSASMGHINTIGSLDRTSLGPKAVGSGGVGEMACRSMATLSRLAPYGGEAPPPYEWTLSLSVEEVVSAGADGWMSGWEGEHDLFSGYVIHVIASRSVIWRSAWWRKSTS